MEALVKLLAQFIEALFGVKEVEKPTTPEAPKPKPKESPSQKVRGYFLHVTEDDLLPVLPDPLKPYAKDFVEAGHANGLDPRFLASISMLETGRGTSKAFLHKNNAMGISDRKGPILMESVSYSIRLQADKMSSPRWPYLNAFTIPEFGAIYSPPGAENDTRGTNKGWPHHVSNIYSEFLSSASRPKSTDEPEPAISDPFSETFKRSPNQGGTIKPKFIVLHSSYGSFAGDQSWILKSSSKVSYHYLIDPKNGNRVQFVEDNRKAWHAGESFWKGYSGLNSHSVGISFTGPSNRKAGEHEIESVAWKCVYLMDKFGLTIDAIITHQMIAPRRKDDTGKSNYERVLAAVERIKAA